LIAGSKRRKPALIIFFNFVGQKVSVALNVVIPSIGQVPEVSIFAANAITSSQ
jgi:hypothetical protein